MRISGGKARGIPLKSPEKGTRPATDRMREAVFSSLGPQIEGARVLDLFAGSGAYGLEALSRGAGSALFIEKDRRAVAVLKQNAAAVAKSMGAGAGAATVRAGDVLRWEPQVGDAFDVIFCDPPYDFVRGCADGIFERAARWLGGCAADSGADEPARGRWLVFEMPAEFRAEPAGWELVRRLGKGSGRDPSVCIYRLLADSTA